MDEKSDFILAAINDAQATIRSIDVKVAALLTGLLIPLASLGKIWWHISHIISLTNLTVGVVAGVVFFLSWMIAVFALVRTISAIDNPSDHIVNSSDYSGCFYGGGLYSFEWSDIILNRSVVKAEKDVSNFSKSYPSTKDQIISELSFEHMKLIYIREIKFHRFKNSLRIATFWLVSGLGLYVFSKIG